MHRFATKLHYAIKCKKIVLHSEDVLHIFIFVQFSIYNPTKQNSLLEVILR